MAIQFIRVEYVSRSKGQNAYCKSAYNARSKVINSNTGKTYSFEALQDNVHHEILLPSYADIKFKDISVLADEVEKNENRKNSQLYKEYVIALPDDTAITLRDRKELVYCFIERKEFLKNGLGVQIDIHKPNENDRNWHAHLLVTTRHFSENGEKLGKKARDLNPEVRRNKFGVYVERDFIGLLWKEIQNEHFAKNSLSISVNGTTNNLDGIGNTYYDNITHLISSENTTVIKETEELSRVDDCNNIKNYHINIVAKKYNPRQYISYGNKPAFAPEKSTVSLLFLWNSIKYKSNDDQQHIVQDKQKVKFRYDSNGQVKGCKL